MLTLTFAPTVHTLIQFNITVARSFQTTTQTQTLYLTSNTAYTYVCTAASHIDDAGRVDLQKHTSHKLVHLNKHMTYYR